MDWCIKEYDEANHPPHVELIPGKDFTVRAGEEILLDASGSSDPDGDQLSFIWFHYREPGSYKGRITIENAGSARTSFIAPAVSVPETAHIILKVTDLGTPPLTRYGRVIVNILPE